MPGELKQFLLGRPLASHEAGHQRLNNPVALAVFSSDALSSVAYATEEILLALIVAGPLVLGLSLPIAIAIGVLLMVVTFSYRQTIKAYPNGGGAYIVAHENLGANAGLVAGSSLLVDYILTVAVSISAGTAAITSAIPSLAPYRVIIAVAFVGILLLANLRGVKESGALFAGPTYFFIGMLALTIVLGLGRALLGMPIQVTPHDVEATQALTLFIVLRAFASGCTAMTGVEAIANGVQAFRQPEATNARKTLTWMAGILLFLFVGVTLLAWISGVRPAEGGETVVSQLARGIYGTGPLYFMLQAATAAILILAANTSYADFPRLGSIMAADGYLPKQLKDRGSRLVYSNGLLLLTGMSVLLLVVFQGDTHALIPLYAVGVFTSFTLSQAGMVQHWRRYPEPGSRWSMLVNGVGAVSTFVVLLVIGYAKFTAGAWIVILLIPILVFYLQWIKNHYADVADRLKMTEEQALSLDWQSMNRLHNHAIVLISGMDRRVVRALQYAKTLKADKVEALYIDISGQAEQVRKQWDECDCGIRLTIIESPYRELLEPLRQYVRSIPRPSNDYVITVILPEFVPEDLVDNMLHDQTSFWIKRMLFFEPGVIVADVPYHMYDEQNRPSAPSTDPEMGRV